MIGREQGAVGELLNDLMRRSHRILSRHPVNLKREREGKNPGNMIWLWGPGSKPRLEPFQKRYGLRGGMISAVNLIRGIGVYAGMEIIDVPGATGYYDTNYEGKADHAVRALDRNDLVYVHVEAPDEAGHEGSAERKVRVLEEFDRRLVGRVLERAHDCVLAVLPDHPTPVSKRVHATDPVPFVICAPNTAGDGLDFSERAGRRGSLGLIEGPEFMKLLLSHR
jgi:2,3-bisphosphoglycerate-independent phosphoglycerate mutase